MRQLGKIKNSIRKNIFSGWKVEIGYFGEKRESVKNIKEAI